jgi:Skp family chaperone for outer membrane proteins
MLATAVLSLGYLISLAVAQQAPARPNGQNIALIDVVAIFKHHARFKALQEEMKATVEQAGTALNRDREEIKKLAEHLPELTKGTREYAQLEEELARRGADLSVRAQLQKGQILQREAAMYNTVYQEILQTTDYYCKQNGIDLVVNFNSDSVDVNRPESVSAFINRPVVWNQNYLNITPVILQELNRAAPAAAARQGVPLNNVR